MGADFLQKYPLVAGTPVTIDADESIVAFDFTNDSPLDIDIQWRQGGPVALTVPPEMIWRGAKPNAALLISGNKRSGRVIATPQIPVGGSPPGGAPAQQLAVHGYMKGNEPPELITPLNRLASIGNQVNVGFNAVLSCDPALSTVYPQPPVTVPLTPAHLDLSKVSPANPGYLVLKYLYSTGGNSSHTKELLLKNESLFQSQIVTVPSNAAGNQQIFSFATANWIKMLGFFGFGAGITINIIEIDKDNSVYEGLILPGPGTITTFGTLDVGAFYGPEGKTNFFGAGGFNVRLTMSNTAGVKTFGMNFYGGKASYDENFFGFSYIDWLGNDYSLGVFRIGQQLILPLEMVVPIPITDPGQSNFGSLGFLLLGNSTTYNLFETVDFSIPCAITFLTPA